MSKSRNNSAKPYIVSVVQDSSECADVQVNATSSDEAEEIVSALLRQGKLNSLAYTPGDNQRDPYTCGSWEKDDDTAVDCIVTDSGITFPPKTNSNTLRHSDGPLTACPQCGAELNAILQLTLYAITLDGTGQYPRMKAGHNQKAPPTLSNLVKPNTPPSFAQTTTTFLDHHLSVRPHKRSRQQNHTCD